MLFYVFMQLVNTLLLSEYYHSVMANDLGGTLSASGLPRRSGSMHTEPRIHITE